jgi:hypothetical protein
MLSERYRVKEKRMLKAEAKSMKNKIQKAAHSSSANILKQFITTPKSLICTVSSCSCREQQLHTQKNLNRNFIKVYDSNE